MAGIYGNSPFRKWTGMPGYTDYGALSPEDVSLLNSFTGKYDPSDVVWGRTPLQGTARQFLGKDPYAVSDDFLKTARAGGAQTKAFASSASAPSKTTGLSGLFSKVKGSKAMGNLSKLGGMLNTAANVAPFAIQGYQTVSGLGDYNDASDNLDDMLASISSSASSNPLVEHYLTNEQLSQLRKVKQGEYDSDSINIGDMLSNGGNILKGAGTGALMGLPFIFSNPYVMLASAALGAVNSGVQNAVHERNEDMSELDNLYAALQQADANYKSMKSPNLTNLGIQQRYQNMYM